MHGNNSVRKDCGYDKYNTREMQYMGKIVLMSNETANVNSRYVTGCKLPSARKSDVLHLWLSTPLQSIFIKAILLSAFVLNFSIGPKS